MAACRRTVFNYATLVHATAGAMGSIVGTICLYPLDNIKFRMQVDDKELLDKTTLEALIYLLMKDGLEPLYRGMSSVIQSSGISNFIYFYTFHYCKSLVPTILKDSSKIDLLLSTIAGAVNVVISCPMWVTNSRLKMSKNLEYSGLVNGILHIAKTEGLGALWNGLGPSLILVSNPVIHFTIYESLKRKITVKSAAGFFLLSALSKTIATILTYPLQLVQTRQRATSEGDLSAVTIIYTLMRRYGLVGIFQGLESKILQTVLTTAVTYMTYEKVAQFVFALLLKESNKKLP